MICTFMMNSTHTHFCVVCATQSCQMDTRTWTFGHFEQNIFMDSQKSTQHKFWPYCCGSYNHGTALMRLHTRTEALSMGVYDDTRAKSWSNFKPCFVGVISVPKVHWIPSWSGWVRFFGESYSFSALLVNNALIKVSEEVVQKAVGWQLLDVRLRPIDCARLLGQNHYFVWFVIMLK